MHVSLVVAASDNNVIGRDGALPWHLPDDLKRFKALTLGKPILMGRKTYESIGRALPQRLNLVLSRQQGFRAADVVVVSSIEAALAAARPAAELMVIGGEGVFTAALPLATTVHLTRVHAQVTGTVCFPALDAQLWRETARTEHPAHDRHAYAMSFVTLVRIGGRLDSTIDST